VPMHWLNNPRTSQQPLQLLVLQLHAPLEHSSPSLHGGPPPQVHPLTPQPSATVALHRTHARLPRLVPTPQ
jgi:hypothetical protein